MPATARQGQAPSGYLGLLRNRQYLGLLISRVLSLVGDQLARVALTVLVYRETGSPFAAAATYAVTFLPVVIGGPLLGGLADRLPRRRLLVAADLLRAGVFAFMALPGLPLWVLLLAVLVATTVEAPWAAARAPLMRDILVDDDGYQRGTGLDETLDNAGQIVGFAAAGALLVVLSPSTALLLNAASFLLSGLVVRLLIAEHEAADVDHDAKADVTAAARRQPLWAAQARRSLADARLGLRAATAVSCRRPLLLTWAGISCSIAPEALAVPWAHSLGAGSFGAGLLFAAGPVGTVVGLLLLGRVSAERGERLLLPLTLLTLLPLALCAFVPSLSWALLLVTVSGIGSSYSMLARVAFIRGVTGAHRGRAFSIAAAGVTAGQGLGIAAAGATAALTSPAVAVALAGAVGVLLVTGAVIGSQANGQTHPAPISEPAPVAADVPDAPAVPLAYPLPEPRQPVTRGAGQAAATT
jgi:MFS family permease